MDYIKNLPVKSRLFLISLIPLVAIILIAILIISEKYQDYKNYEKLESLMTLNADISLLVNETQKERGASAGYIGSKGAKFSDILKNQRVLTNEKIDLLQKSVKNSDLREILDNESVQLLDNVLNTLAKIETKRTNVDSFNISLKDALSYYTKLNASMLHLNTLAFKLSKDTYITTHSMAYYSFLESKERAGIERAVGSAIFGAGYLKPELQARFISLVAKQDAFMNSFVGIADQEMIDFKNKILKGDAISEVNRMRDIIINALPDTKFEVDATYWFKTITSKINMLKQVDDWISNEILTKTVERKDKSLSELVSYIIVIFLVVFGTTLFANYISRTIREAIEKVRAGIETFFDFMNRKRNTFEFIDVKSKGELGEIATFVNDNLVVLEKELEADMKCVGEAILVLNKLQQGNLENQVMAMPSNPQIRTFATTINKMLKHQKSAMDNILNELNNYTNYNYLSKLPDQDMKGEMKQLIDGINSLGDAITKMLQENKNNGDILSSNANNMVQNVEQLNSSAVSQAASIEETAASIEETTSSINEISNQASQMQTLSKETLTYANEGLDLASKTQKSMDEINNATQEINEAITIIDQIAFQTNILSLNAAVEAATAGEAGKGFAVVAQEVRNLASRSAEAAKEIKSLVEKANLKATEGKSSSEKMIDGYSSLNEKISSTGEIITQVASSTIEQSKTISQINESISKIDQLTQENANIASHTKEAAIKTSSLAEDIIKNTSNKQFNLN